MEKHINHAAMFAQACRDAGLSPAEVAAGPAAGRSFVPCDSAEVRRFLAHSYRIKAVLVGKQLGSNRPGHWDGHERERLTGAKRGNALSIVARRAKREAVNQWVIGPIRAMKARRWKLKKIADWLNKQGYRTTRRKLFLPSSVHKIIEQFADKPTPIVPIAFSSGQVS